MSYNVPRSQGRKTRSSSILSRLSEKELKLVKVAVTRRNIPENPNPPPLIRNIGNPADLILHREGEGKRPIFDREDIVVNQDELLEDRIVLNSPLHEKKRSSSSSSSSRSSSRSKSLTPDKKKNRNRKNSRSLEKPSDTEKTHEDYFHTRSKSDVKEKPSFKLEGIFDNLSNVKKCRYDKNKKLRDRSRSKESSRKCDSEREKYYRERERSKEKERCIPSDGYPRKSISPHFKGKNVRSSRSRSRSPRPSHSRKRSRSSEVNPKRYSRSPRKSRSSERRRYSRSPPRKKYSRSPDRRRDEMGYKGRRKSPYKDYYRRSPAKGFSDRRTRERSPYKKRSSSPREKAVKRSHLDEQIAMGEGDYMIPEYGYMDGQPIWFPGPLPFPHYGMRQPVPYSRFRGPMIRPFPVPVAPYFRPRFPMYNRPQRPNVPSCTVTTTTSTPTTTSSDTMSKLTGQDVVSVSVTESSTFSSEENSTTKQGNDESKVTIEDITEADAN